MPKPDSACVAVVTRVFAIFLLCHLFACASEDGSSPIKKADHGLRLELTVTSVQENGADVHNVCLDLRNTRAEPVRLLHTWEADHQRPRPEDVFSCYYTTMPEVLGHGGMQTMWVPKKYGKMEVVIQPGSALTKSWKSDYTFGLRLAQPGRYQVRAHTGVEVRGSGHVSLESNWASVVVGGVLTPPRSTVATIKAFDKEKRTATLDIGAEQQVKTGEIFDLFERGYGNFRLKVTEVEAKQSTAEIIFNEQQRRDEATAWQRVRVGAKGELIAPDHDGSKALYDAVQAGQLDKVRELITNNPGLVNKPVYYHQRALHTACARGDAAMASLLLKRGALINAPGDNRRTPLHGAVQAEKGAPEVVALLLNQGADVNARAVSSWPLTGDGETPLHLAAQRKPEIAKLLLERGAVVNAATDTGHTPLHVAARQGNKAAIALLLEHKAEVNAKTAEGLTPLHCAAQNGNVAAVELMLAQGADLNALDKLGHSALYHAATGRYRFARADGDTDEKFEAAELLAGKGAAWDLWSAMALGRLDNAAELLKANPAEAAKLGPGETPPLHWAAKKQRKAVMDLLLDTKPVVDRRDSFGRTALHWAARTGNLAIAGALLNHGADPNAKDQVDETSPLLLAVVFEHPAMVTLLLKRGATASICNFDKETPLHLAAEMGRLDIMRELLAHKAELNVRGEWGRTPLLATLRQFRSDGFLSMSERARDVELNYYTDSKNAVVKAGSQEAMREAFNLLIKHGADIKAAESDGDTVLHNAVGAREEELAKLLLERGADVNARNFQGGTPLHSCMGGWSMSESRDEKATRVAELLIKHNADITVADKDGNTPLHCAAARERDGIVKALLAAKADPRARNKAGRAPLHEAAQRAAEKVVPLLLEANADLDAQDEKGLTALHIAASGPGGGDGMMVKFKAIVQALLERKANPKLSDKEGRSALYYAEKRLVAHKDQKPSKERDYCIDVVEMLEKAGR